MILVREDISNAKALLQNKPYENDYGRIYPFTNENLRDYLGNFDLSGKDILTVTASGDHPLNIAIQNPKSITCFDKNRLAMYWTELKRAGILTMNREEFINTFVHELSDRCNFSIYNKKKSLLFSMKNYNKIREALDEKNKVFWDTMIKEITVYYFTGPPHMNGTNDRKQEIPQHVQGVNKYLDKKHYDKLKTTLHDLKFSYINSHIYGLGGDERYDAVFTSNISDSLIEAEYDYFVRNEIRRMIKPGGLAQTHIHSDFAHKSIPPLEGIKEKQITINNKIGVCSLRRAEQSTFVSIHKD